jgi:hypothetical protein
MDGLLTWIWPGCRWIEDVRRTSGYFRSAAWADLKWEQSPWTSSGLARWGRSCRLCAIVET